MKFHVDIGFLDRLDDFVVKFCLQLFGMFRVSLGVVIFQFQVRENLFVLSLVVAQPEKVIVDLDSWIHGIFTSVLARDDPE